MQVITTLKRNTFPITEVPFPAVTICGSGHHMDNVRNVLQRNFAKWRQAIGKRDVNLVAKDFAEYMEDKFQITSERSNGDTHPPNILDMLDTMVASDVESSVAANGVRQNAFACSEEKANAKGRRKRTAAEMASSVDGYNCEEYGYYSYASGSSIGQVDDWTDCLKKCLENETCQYWQWKTAESPNAAKKCFLSVELGGNDSDYVGSWGIPKVKHIRGPRSCKREANLLSGKSSSVMISFQKFCFRP